GDEGEGVSASHELISALGTVSQGVHDGHVGDLNGSPANVKDGGEEDVVEEYVAGGERSVRVVTSNLGERMEEQSKERWKHNDATENVPGSSATDSSLEFVTESTDEWCHETIGELSSQHGYTGLTG